MPPSDRAGQPAAPSDLVDVAKLVTAYYTEHPDVGRPDQRVAFGTSGHRGSALTLSFNSDHIVATSQAICDYRAGAGIDGPLFLAKDTHALSEPAFVDALEVFAGNGVRVLVDARDTYTPTPAACPTRSSAQRGPRHRAGRRSRGDPVAQPAPRRRLQVQPTERRAGRHRHHPVVQDRANELLAAGLSGVRRVPYATARAADTTGTYDYVDAYVADLPAALDLAAVRDAGGDHRGRPARRRLPAVLGRDRRAATASTSPWSTRWSTPPGGS
jgi:phosphoglucomutase